MLRKTILWAGLCMYASALHAVFNDVPSIYPFEVVSLETVMKKYGDEIRYQSFREVQEVYYDPLPFIPDEFKSFQPHHVTFDKTWVLTVPHGRVCSEWGYVVIDEKYILRELMWPCLRFFHALNLFNCNTNAFKQVRKVSGRVAVISCPGSTNYAHFLMEILGRLAILEIMGIDYDWIYMTYDGNSYHAPYKEQILEAWGINKAKIIEPFGEFTCIEADELIVPSRAFYLVPTPGHTQYSHYTPLCGVYSPEWLVQYYRDKFLPLIGKTSKTYATKGKRIFISRADSRLRIMVNEDEVFKLFEACGFKKYLLTNLTFLEQIELFHDAEIVVGANGAGLYNMLFCPADGKIIEIFQERVDSSFTFLAQTLGLEYTPIQTVPFPLHDPEGGMPSIVPLDIIEEFIKKLGL